MLTLFSDFDRPFDNFDDLRKQVYRLFDDYQPGAGAARQQQGSPRFFVRDEGEQLVIWADVPGLTEKDVTIELTSEVLSVRGERKIALPEGYRAVRQERSAFQFARAFTLPLRVDPEQTTAVVKHGVLTVTLAKAREAKPRKIDVKSA